MMTVREKRRLVHRGRLTLIVLTTAVLLTPKDIEVPIDLSLPVIGQAMASEQDPA